MPCREGRDWSLPARSMIYGETTPVPEPTLTIHGRTAGALTSMPFFFLRRVSHAARHEWVCGRHTPSSSSSRWRRVLRRARVPPFLKKVDGIVKGHDFPDPVLSPLQLNRSCKHSRVHLTSLNTTVFNKKGAVDAPAVDLLPSVPWFKRLHPILVADHRSAAWLGCPARFRSCNAHR